MFYEVPLVDDDSVVQLDLLVRGNDGTNHQVSSFSQEAAVKREAEGHTHSRISWTSKPTTLKRYKIVATMWLPHAGM